MRSAVVVGILVVTTPALARADRGESIELGITGDARATGRTFSVAGDSDQLAKLGGARIVLSFEDDPLPYPELGRVSSDVRLVPELLAGFLADDVHAEGFVGAGLRGEVQLASHRSETAMRTALYVAARAIVIDKGQDAAGEFVVGEYLSLSHGRRFGWEGGAMLRPQGDQPGRELDALLTIYVGWR